MISEEGCIAALVIFMLASASSLYAVRYRLRFKVKFGQKIQQSSSSPITPFKLIIYHIINNRAAEQSENVAVHVCV